MARIREARFEDHAGVAPLEERYGLFTTPEADWRRRWEANPAIRGATEPWPMGWVIETEAGDIAGFFGNIPMAYEIDGERLLAAATNSWVVDDDQRGQALELLGEGLPPERVIGQLLADDPRRELRQLAIIDMTGRVANHNPSAAPVRSRYWGAQSGRFYSCQGNTLAGRKVISEMARAYEQTKGSLADRLMAALVAGDCAGGDHRGRLAAGIKVARRGKPGTWFQLHVDKSDDAVAELLKKYVASKHPAKGAWSGGRGPFRHPCPRARAKKK